MKSEPSSGHRTVGARYNRVGIVYNGKLDPAKGFAVELEKFVRGSVGAAWRLASYQEDEIKNQLADTDLIISVGGDGTLLRTARLVASDETSILGINLGRLGFTTEFTAGEALEELPRIFAGEGWTDIRSMLSVRTSSDPRRFQTLNDVVIGRGAISRIIRIETKVNGQLLTTYRADGLIIATATGSTGYSMAAGGPILHAQSTDILLQAICPHLSFPHCLILPSDVTINIKVTTDHQAILNMDGQIDVPLADSEQITVQLSENRVSLLRLRSPDSYYGSLAQRLKGA